MWEIQAMIRIVVTALGVLGALALDGAVTPLLAQAQPQQPAQRPPAQQQRPPAQTAPRPPASQAQPRPAPAPPSVQNQQQAQPQRQLPPKPPDQPLPPEGTMVVTIDYNSVVQNSAAGLAARTQLDRRRTQLQQEVTQQETDLRKQRDDLEKQRTILAQDALGQKAREFESRVAAFQQSTQERGKSLEEATRDAETRIKKELNAILSEIMTEMKYQIVLPKEMVVGAITQLEIGGEVLKRLNKKLPTFQVNFAKIGN
jgi:Skp family chaperone for outer membrane proteins